MMNLKGKQTILKGVYTIAISVTAGILFLTGILFSRVEMSTNAVIPTQSVETKSSASNKKVQQKRKQKRQQKNQQTKILKRKRRKRLQKKPRQRNQKHQKKQKNLVRQK